MLSPSAAFTSLRDPRIACRGSRRSADIGQAQQLLFSAVPAHHACICAGARIRVRADHAGAAVMARLGAEVGVAVDGHIARMPAGAGIRAGIRIQTDH